jgi:hypothetical protein
MLVTWKLAQVHHHHHHDVVQTAKSHTPSPEPTEKNNLLAHPSMTPPSQTASPSLPSSNLRGKPVKHTRSPQVDCTPATLASSCATHAPNLCLLGPTRTSKCAPAYWPIGSIKTTPSHSATSRSPMCVSLAHRSRAILRYALRPALFTHRIISPTNGI